MKNHIIPGTVMLDAMRANSALVRGILGNGIVPNSVIIEGSGPIELSEMHDCITECGLSYITVDDLMEDWDEEWLEEYLTGILIVGQKNWDSDELNLIIDAHKEKPLRVYSQEMILASIALQNDVYDVYETDDLIQFGNGHPVLEYLSQDRGFDWPTTEITPNKHIVVNFCELNSPERGFLTLSGYKVGKTSKLTVKERHDILDEIFIVQIEPQNTADKKYADQWGFPKTSQRLKKMANCIASLARLQKRNSPTMYAFAIADWEEDLEYLKDKYHHMFESNFRWPDTN